MWNQGIFFKNVTQLCNDRCDGNKAEFGRRIGDRDCIQKWKDGKRPSLNKFLMIVDKFNVSADWLLTGHDGKGVYVHPDALGLCNTINEIYASDDKTAQKSIELFVDFVRDRIKESKEMKQRIADLEKAANSPSPGKSHDTQRKAESSIKKRKKAV